MKKILIFSLAYYPHVGGAEIAIKEITDHIPNVEFHMVTLVFGKDLEREEKIGNVVVHRIGSGRAGILNKFLFQFRAPLYALALQRKYNFDCVWAVMAHSSGVPAAIFKLFYRAIPYVLTLQEGDPPKRIELKMFPLWPLFSRAFTSANAVQAISNFLGEWARERGFKGPLFVIPNGVDTAHFTQEYSPRTIDEIKDKLGKQMGDIFLITTSRLVHKNAVDDVIAALSELPENVKFIILGDGPLEEQLKKQAQRLNLEQRVQFLGHIDLRDIPKYLHASDIFVRPSRSEGMGNSFIEAMAVGIPVISTQEGGIADFLFDEERNKNKPVTGFAVNKDAPEDIAAQVKNIMEHPEKVRAVVATAKALVVERYDWEIVAREMQNQVFTPLLNSNT